MRAEIERYSCTVHREHGQSLVELALIGPILIVIVLVVLDLGRIFATWIGVSNGAREAAYFASRSVPGGVSDAAIRSVAAAEGSGAAIVADATHVVISYPSQDLISVTVSSPFQPVAPMVGLLWNGSSPLISARAVFPVVIATSTAIPITPSTPLPTSTPTPLATPTSAFTSTPTGTGTLGATSTPVPGATATVTRTPTPSPTAPSIILVQSKGDAQKASSVSVTFTTAPVVGDLLVAIVGSNNASPLTLSNSGWSTALDNSSVNASEVIFYRIAGASEPATVTANRNGSGQGVGLQLFEYSGVASSNPLDTTATGTDGSSISEATGTFTCGSVTTTQANELIISGLANAAASGTNVNNAWNSSFSERLDLRDSSDRVLVAAAHRIVTTTGTYQTGSNLQGGSGTGDTRCMTAAFKASF